MRLRTAVHAIWVLLLWLTRVWLVEPPNELQCYHCGLKSACKVLKPCKSCWLMDGYAVCNSRTTCDRHADPNQCCATNFCIPKRHKPLVAKLKCYSCSNCQTVASSTELVTNVDIVACAVGRRLSDGIIIRSYLKYPCSPGIISNKVRWYCCNTADLCNGSPWGDYEKSQERFLGQITTTTAVPISNKTDEPVPINKNCKSTPDSSSVSGLLCYSCSNCERIIRGITSTELGCDQCSYINRNNSNVFSRFCETKITASIADPLKQYCSSNLCNGVDLAPQLLYPTLILPFLFVLILL